MFSLLQSLHISREELHDSHLSDGAFVIFELCNKFFLLYNTFTLIDLHFYSDIQMNLKNQVELSLLF